MYVFFLVDAIPAFSHNMNLKRFEYETLNGERTLDDILKLNDNKNGIILNATIRGHEKESIVTHFKTRGEHLILQPCLSNFYSLETSENETRDVIVIRFMFNCKCILKKNTQIFKLES